MLRAETERYFEQSPMDWWREDQPGRFSRYSASQIEEQARHAIDCLVSIEGNNPPIRIGVLGFGFGRETEMAVNAFQEERFGVEVKFVGIDINSSRFQVARENMSASSYELVEPVAGSIHAVPLKSDSLDAVMCLETMMHADDPAKAMHEMVRITKPEGYVVFNTLVSHGLFSDCLRFLLVHGPKRTGQRVIERMSSSEDNSASRTKHIPLEELHNIMLQISDATVVETKKYVMGINQFIVLQKQKKL